MQVFKLFFQIIKKNAVVVFVTTALALGISLLSISANTSNTEVKKINIAIIDKDKTELSSALIDQMKETSYVKDINASNIEDALFYGDIDYVLYIPVGYEGAVKANNEIHLEKKQVPNSMSAYMIDEYATSFTNTIRAYLAYNPELKMSDAIQKTKIDLGKKVEMNSQKSEKTVDVQYYFNFLSYSIVSSLIFGIGVVMIALNNVDIKRRNSVSPLSETKMSIQLSSAATVFGVGIVIVCSAFSYIFFSSGMTTPGAYLYIVNLFVYLIPCLGLSYLVSSLIRKPEALSGVSNILCLGLAFLGGAFVPQALLSSSVLSFSRFIPSYWFIQVNDKIRDLTNVSSYATSPIYKAMMIQVVFGVVFFVIAIAINKYRRKNII